MKRALVWIVIGAAAALPSCDEQKSTVVMPPPPLPRYLSRDIARPPSQADDAPKTTASAEADPAATPDGQTTRSPEEIAQQVRDLEPALRRLQQRRASPEAGGGTLGTNEAPPVREGEPPVRVSVAVPMEGDQPVRRPDAGQTPPAGRVSLTAIEAADDGHGVPVPQDDRGAASPGKAEPEDVEPPAGDVTLENLTRHYEALAAANPADA